MFNLNVDFIYKETLIHIMENGEVKIHKIGKSVRLKASEVNAWFDSLPTQGG